MPPLQRRQRAAHVRVPQVHFHFVAQLRVGFVQHVALFHGFLLALRKLAQEVVDQRPVFLADTCSHMSARSIPKHLSKSPIRSEASTRFRKRMRARCALCRIAAACVPAALASAASVEKYSGFSSLWFRISRSIGLNLAKLSFTAFRSSSRHCLAIRSMGGRLYSLNSDQASSVLEGWAMAHGNPLLSGWTLPSDNFFTDKLPLLALIEKF